jgi:hypothetical protein
MFGTNDGKGKLIWGFKERRPIIVTTLCKESKKVL